jgi:trans-2,3-dihydro-3-hydroxyanthranilate isomerase
VVDETSLTDTQRCAVPVAAGTSHVVFISTDERGPGRPAVSLRFFTTAAELPACGHGTVAVLAERAGTQEYEAVLRSGGRTFLGQATGDGEPI